LPTVLHLNKEDIDTPEKRAGYTISLVGCGQKAISYALAFAETGFKVKCVDEDQSVTRRLSRGYLRLRDSETEKRLKQFARTEQISATSDLKAAASASDIIVLTIDVKVDDKKCADYSEILNVCKQLGASLRKDGLVIYAGAGGFGLTETVIKENLENTSGLRAGDDFGLAYSRTVATEKGRLMLKEIQVAANDKASLDSAALIFEVIAEKGVTRTSGIKIAELASLVAAVRRDSTVALANELAIFCEAAGVDYFEMVKLLNNSRENGFSPTISEETSRNEAYIMLENGDNLNVKLRLLATARQVNEIAVRHAINLTQDALHSIGKPLRRARMAVLGSSLEPGTASLVFVETLETRGSKVARYDPFSPEKGLTKEGDSVKRTLNEAAEGADCVVVLSEDEQFKRLNLKKLHTIMKSPAAFVDLTNQFDPKNIEQAGFIYRGLGKGVWKK